MFVIGIALLVAQVAVPVQAQEVYKVELVRATPGGLLDLIAWYQRERDAIQDPSRRPWVLRHSQGDHWDLMVVTPIGSLPEYFSDDQVDARAARRNAPSGWQVRQRLVAFSEETFFSGPRVDVLTPKFAESNFFHIEMFVALAGLRDELHREREMENVYLVELGRKPNTIFTKVVGGRFDSMTIGFYQSHVHFAESGVVAAEEEDRAAQAAGFEAANRIGSFLRTLIHEHHDTLATKVN